MKVISGNLHRLEVAGGESVSDPLDEWFTGEPTRLCFNQESIRQKAQGKERGMLKVNHVEVELACCVRLEEEVFVVKIAVAEGKLLL